MIGDFFPEMKVQTTHGEKRLPQDYQGKWFIFFSHPGDFTPVCTTEYVEFQALSQEFTKFNTELIGLSVDQVYPHLKWIEWIQQNLNIEITFPVIADPAGEVSQKLGMLRRGRETRTVRTVYIIDPEGIIRLILIYPPEVGRNIYEILRIVQALQITDQCNGAAPANWPNNQLIQNHLIISPAGNIDEIKERNRQVQSGEIHCFDWWFCYKPIS